MLNSGHQLIKIAIIGTGRVGASCAYALQLRGLAYEIVLINANRQRAEGEAMDISHGSQFTKPIRVWAGDYRDCRDADIVVLAAGTSQKPGVKIFKSSDQLNSELRRSNSAPPPTPPQCHTHQPYAAVSARASPIHGRRFVRGSRLSESERF